MIPNISDGTRQVMIRSKSGEIAAVKAELDLIGGKHAEKVREIGRLLCELKEVVPHGGFEAYVSRELKIDPRNARRWMARWVESTSGKTDKLSVLKPEPTTPQKACQDDEMQGFVPPRRRASESDESVQEPMSDAERAAWLDEGHDDEEERADLADAGLVLDGEGVGDGKGEVGTGGGASSPLEHGRDARDGAHAHQTGPNASRVARDEPAGALHARAAIVAPLHVARPALTPLSERGVTHTQMTLDREYQAAEGLRRLTAMVEAGRLDDGELAEVEKLVARICRKAVAP